MELSADKIRGTLVSGRPPHDARSRLREAAYLSENKTPAAEVFRAGAIRLSLPLTEGK